MSVGVGGRGEYVIPGAIIAANSHDMSSLIFSEKLNEMYFRMMTAAVVTGA